MAPRPHSLASAKEKKKKQAQAIRGWQMTLVGLKLMFYIIHKRKERKKEMLTCIDQAIRDFLSIRKCTLFLFNKAKKSSLCMFMTKRTSSRWKMDRDASRYVARVGLAENQVFQNVDWLNSM
jgi:hypothetical protein